VLRHLPPRPSRARSVGTPSEMPSQPRSVSAFRLGQASVGPRASGDLRYCQPSPSRHQEIPYFFILRSHMKTSLRLVFLGFAFHRLNIELLLPKASSTSPPTRRSVFATAHGISDSDTKAISDELTTRDVLSARDIQIRNDLTCSQLFQEYSRSRSFT
jgi:hypothetical protein